MCMYERRITNKRYTETAKNRGVIPPVKDPRALTIDIPCGECMECRKKYANEWRARLTEDIKEHKNGKFITLTFSTEWLQILDKQVPNIVVKKKKFRKDYELEEIIGYKRDNFIAKQAVRRFLERWRKQFGKSLRHWLITELGHKGTEHLHLHGIVWTDDLEAVERHWKYGFVWKGTPIVKRGKVIRYENYVNERTVNYIVKYITKRDETHKTYKSKVLTSAGIGRNYINTPAYNRNVFNGTETREYYKTGTGHKIAMPKYWRNKRYNEDEREELWMNKLNEGFKYICGERVNMESNYEQALEHYRKLNKELGYGGGKKDWKRAHYENQKRIAIHSKRMAINTNGT